MISKGKSMFTPGKDNRVKIMNERIIMTEKHIGEMCSVFAAHTRKLGRYRDKHDELAKVLKAFADEESFSKSSASGLDSISKAITFIADFMDLEVQRMECKVISELSQYEAHSRNTRESLKAAVIIRDKEVARQKQLIEIRTKFTVNSTAADTELLKTKLEVNRTNKDIDNVIEDFEKRKLKDVKNILLDFIAIQLKQHTKSIEVLSATYQDIADIDERKDFQTFRRSLKVKPVPVAGYLRKFRSQSMDSLGTPRRLSTARPKSERLSKSTRNLAAELDEPDENESDRDESDDDDDDDEETSPPPDADSNDGDDTESDEEESNSEARKDPQPSARVPNFKTFCEGVQVHKDEPNTRVATAPSAHRRIRVKSINGTLRRN